LISDILQVLVILIFPVLAIWLGGFKRLGAFLSPIVLCFAAGIIIRNFGLLSVSDGISGNIRDVSILFAMPMLLFSSDVRSWLTQSRKTLLSFLFAVSAGCIAATLAALIFRSSIDDIWIPAGMMVGIHTGGTPNLFAVGIALNAQDEVITLTNSAQILWGAMYLLFLLSLAPSLTSLILKDHSDSEDRHSTSHSYTNYKAVSIADVIKAVIMTVIIIASGVGISFLFFDFMSPTFIIIFVTTIAVTLSFSKYVRDLRGPFEVGDYLLLVFGVAVGMMSDFWVLIEEGGPYILFVAIILLGTFLMHLLLARLTGIDCHTFLITSTAAIFGPVFIPQVAQALKNRSLILGGVAVSLAGLAIGNYIGISMAYLIEYIV